jgi:PAS domain S-box-containing protein
MLRFALESVPCGMVMVDSQGRIALVNAQTEKLFGYPREELLGQSMDILIPERVRNQHHLLQESYLAQPVSRAMGMGRDLCGRRRDGSEIPIEIGLNVFNTEKGDFVLSTIVDITERRRLEAALVQSQKMEALGQLAGGVAHDFNNLLSGLLGCLEILGKRHVSSEAGKRLIAEGRRTVDRGVALTTRLLAFSRQAPMVTEAVDLNRLIEDMLELLTRTLGNAGSIVTKFSSDLWLANVDRQQIEIAMLNLTLNARDAMPQGGMITLETHNAYFASALDGMAAGHYVVLKITDTGCGIPPEALPRVVEPFYTTKPCGKGTGLGLSMVHGVAHQLGGGLRIASTVNAGTTVSLYLPRCSDGYQRVAFARTAANGSVSQVYGNAAEDSWRNTSP